MWLNRHGPKIQFNLKNPNPKFNQIKFVENKKQNNNKTSFSVREFDAIYANDVIINVMSVVFLSVFRIFLFLHSLYSNVAAVYDVVVVVTVSIAYFHFPSITNFGKFLITIDIAIPLDRVSTCIFNGNLWRCEMANTHRETENYVCIFVYIKWVTRFTPEKIGCH